MIYRRRHVLRAATLLLAALGLPALTHLALAQQTHGKAELKISEMKPVIAEYVEKMSQAAKKRTGVEFSEQQKIELAAGILSNMKDRGIYDFVDP